MYYFLMTVISIFQVNTNLLPIYIIRLIFDTRYTVKVNSPNYPYIFCEVDSRVRKQPSQYYYIVLHSGYWSSKKLEERNGENIYVKCVIPKSLNTHQLMRPKSFERRRMCWTITTSTNIHISFGSMSVCVAVSLSHLFILKLLRVRISFFVFPFPFPHFFPFPLQLASFFG